MQENQKIKQKLEEKVEVSKQKQILEFQEKNVNLLSLVNQLKLLLSLEKR